MSRRPPHRLWAIGAIIIGLIVVTLILATVLLEGPLKRYTEDQAGQRLRDYEVQIGAIHVHPFRLALELNERRPLPGRTRYEA